MRTNLEVPHNIKDSTSLAYYRLVLAVAGTFYLIWYFVVEILIPNSFNPFISRLLTVLCLWSVSLLSYYSSSVRKHIEFWFSFCAWIASLHFYYLFYNNRLDHAWVWGCYMAVIAIAALMQTMQSMISYMVYILILSIAITFLSPNLQNTLFLPGIITILGVAIIGLRSRLKLMAVVQENNLEIRRLLDATFEGMALHDGEFIIDTNESMASMFGYSRQELIGKSIFTLSTLEGAQRAAAHIAQKSELPYEATGIRKDGSHFFMQVRGKKHIIKNGVESRVAAIQDITELKKNEQTKILFEASQEALRIRNEFISIASHELKTPLTSIKLQTQLTQMAAAKGDPLAYSPERMKKFVSQIDKQANRLTNLIDDMLDVSKISLGKLDLKKEECSLNQLIEETLESLNDLINQSGNQIILQLEEKVNANVDHFRIEQVIINLLTNAIKYGEGNPITISLSKNGQNVSLSVSDQGMGIAKEHQERIFDRFERAITAKNISGLGLGLYITQQIVQAHNGNILVQSSPNEGACFIVNLPSQ